MGSLIIALDAIIAFQQAQARITQLLQLAATENRDLTDEEVAAIQAKSIKLEDEWLSRNP